MQLKNKPVPFMVELTPLFCLFPDPRASDSNSNAQTHGLGLAFFPFFSVFESRVCCKLGLPLLGIKCVPSHPA